MLNLRSLKSCVILCAVFAILTLSEFDIHASSKRVYVTNAGNNTFQLLIHQTIKYP